ncbi:hypothetical protein B0T19DRAFT_205771 [Cercophora scortea]|uniref:Uncharacterized protein n=1 Tax=Cercophora scortea TaxID=314031 RepID=A0AAE0IE86_9PEZI|nr:hypothetical protein B0T19DRAFT_205771 [Cercophora scortea]
MGAGLFPAFRITYFMIRDFVGHWSPASRSYALMDPARLGNASTTICKRLKTIICPGHSKQGERGQKPARRGFRPPAGFFPFLFVCMSAPLFSCLSALCVCQGPSLCSKQDNLPVCVPWPWLSHLLGEWPPLRRTRTSPLCRFRITLHPLASLHLQIRCITQCVNWRSSTCTSLCWTGNIDRLTRSVGGTRAIIMS